MADPEIVVGANFDSMELAQLTIQRWIVNRNKLFKSYNATHEL